MGPAIPMSNSTLRDRIGDLMRMTAPNVPMKVGAGNEVRQRGIYAVFLCQEKMPELVRQQNAHQRERERHSQQNSPRVFQDPAQMKKRKNESVRVEGRQIVREVVLQPRSHNQRGQQRQHKKKNVQPVPPVPRGSGDEHLRIRRNLKCIRSRRRGFRHGKQLSVVSCQYSVYKVMRETRGDDCKPRLRRQPETDNRQLTTLTRSTATPCRA